MFNFQFDLAPGAGGSDDWAYADAKVPYSYTVELRGYDNRHHFDLPLDQIVPAGQETFAGIIAMVKAIKAKLG